jgi:hypothetical protein
MESGTGVLKIGCAFLMSIVLVIVILFMYLADDLCGNDVFSELWSPNKEYKAVIFQRNCGATTDFNTQISIIQSSDALGNDGGNVLIIKGHPQDVSPVLLWNSNNELTINKAINGSEFKVEKMVGTINIKYGVDRT